MPTPDRSHALDHVVVVLFENQSFDTLLGRRYHPGEVPTCEGVIGKELGQSGHDISPDATIKGAEGLAKVRDLFDHLFPIWATRANRRRRDVRERGSCAPLHGRPEERS
jgi:hypothetical protein